MKKQRDLPTTLYRILLYLSRKQNSEDDSRIQSRIERAVGIERKELKVHLENLSKSCIFNENPCRFLRKMQKSRYEVVIVIFAAPARTR